MVGAPDGGSIFHVALPLGDPAVPTDQPRVALVVPPAVPSYEDHASGQAPA